MTATARRPSATADAVAPLRRAGIIGLFLLVPVVLLITLWPTHALLRLKPVVVRGLTALHDRGILEPLTWVRLEVLANVAMLVPVGLALVLAIGGRRWLLAVAACAGLSLAVELAQHAMPGRIASPLDVVANTAGALLGALLALALERWARARRAGSRRAGVR